MGGLRVGCLLAPLLTVAMAVLGWVLVSEGSAGRAVLEGYVAEVRAGTQVSYAVGGDEASALTEVLSTSSTLRISNFQGQAGTACFWTRVHTAAGPKKVRFVLDTNRAVVTAASMRRDCLCPDPDFELPCQLR